MSINVKGVKTLHAGCYVSNALKCLEISACGVFEKVLLPLSFSLEVILIIKIISD